MEVIAVTDSIPFCVLLSIVCSAMKLSSMSKVSNAFPVFGVISWTFFTSGVATSLKRFCVFDTHRLKVDCTASAKKKCFMHSPD